MNEYDVSRFVTAQKNEFELACNEIKAGQKQSHWMWYIFPQLNALGYSSAAKYYGIVDLNEARVYMAEPYLRENLIAISRALLGLQESNPYTVMGYTDALKLCSCMTLFEIAAPDVPEFGMVLEKFYNGVRDSNTIEILNKQNIK